MSGRINLLGAVLALQLVLAGLLLFADVAGDRSGQSAFLDGAPAAVSAFEIADTDERSVRLARTQDGWTVSSPGDAEVPALGPLPADEAKVLEVLDKLFGQRTQWPVGTTAATRERFEVTAAAFQRKLMLTDAEGEVTEVFLGTSPGFRRVHARRSDADEVYSIDFANYQAPAELDEWVDKTVLAARGSIAEVARRGAWTLTRDGEGWLVDGRAADQEAAEDLVRRFDDLRISGVSVAPAEGATAGQELASPTALYTVTDDEGSYVLRLSGGEEDTEYTVTSDRLEGRFTVASYVAEQLLVDADDLAASGDVEALSAPERQ